MGYIYLYFFTIKSTLICARTTLYTSMIAVARWFSVSVCLSLVGVLSKRMDGWSLFLTRIISLTYPTLYCKKLLVSPEHNGSSVRNFVPNSGVRKCCRDTSIVATCRQLWSTKVDAWCDKLATVVGRTTLTILTTIDVRSTSLAMQFVTLSVHRCVQQNVVARVRLRQLSVGRQTHSPGSPVCYDTGQSKFLPVFR